MKLNDAEVIPIVWVVLNRVSVQREAVEVGQPLQQTKVSKLLDLVSVKVDPESKESKNSET